MKSKIKPTAVADEFPLRKLVICFMASGMALIFLKPPFLGRADAAEGSAKMTPKEDVMAAVPDLIAKT